MTSHEAELPARKAALEAMGRRLRLAREIRRITLQEVADAAGVLRQAVANWEGGIKEPGALKLRAAAEFLGVSVDWIIAEEGEGPSKGKAALRSLINEIERKIASLPQ